MCDYSMHAVKNRKAVVGDKIVTSNFNGRSSPGIESLAPGEVSVAICLLPGTGIEFDKPIEYRGAGYRPIISSYKIGRYVRKPSPGSYADHLQFADGTMILMAYLLPGQTGTVTYVPEEVAKQTNEAVPVKKSVRRRVADLLNY